MDVFNQTINTDIETMEKNETIRMNSFRMKEKLLFKTYDAKKRKDQLIEITEKLHDK